MKTDDSSGSRRGSRWYRRLQRLVKELLDESAERWHVSRGVARWIFWIPLAGLAGLLLLRLHKPAFVFLLIEDGPIEWLQFVGFIIAGFAAAGTWHRQRVAGRPCTALLFACYAVTALFVAGEEISWGQRLFGVPTPKFIVEINDQAEITIHNLRRILPIFNWSMLLIGAGGIITCLWNVKLRQPSQWAPMTYIFVPPFFLLPAFLVVFANRLLRLTILTGPGFTVTKIGEWSELCLALAVCTYAVLHFRRCSDPTAEGPTT